MLNLLGVIPLRRLTLLSAAISCSSHLAKDGTWCSLPLSLLGFGMACSCTDLVHAVTVYLCSSGQVFSWVWKALFFYSHHLCLLQSVCPYSAVIPEPWAGVCDIDASVRAEHSAPLISCSMTGCGSLLIALTAKKPSLMRIERYTNQWV